MDGRRFTRLTRILAAPGTRRALLSLLSALPLAGALVPLADEEAAAKKRRHKRKDRHRRNQKHRQGRRRQEQQRREQQRKARRCANCPTGCCAGNTCQPGTANGACGAGGGACTVCSTPTPVCLNHVCAACTAASHCPAGSLCDGGVCQPCTVSAGGNLQAALTGGGTVYVCPGTYPGNFTTPVDVTLVGAGQGADPQHDTILDGELAGQVLVAPEGVTVALRQVRITRGFKYGMPGAGSFHAGYGGGILHAGTLLTMTDCTVTGNRATTGESDFCAGGGICNFGNRLEMTRCTVSDNHAEADAAKSASGGGIFTFADLVMIDCLIADNTAKSDGGGLYNGNLAALTGCEVTGNTVTDAGAGGGSGIVVAPTGVLTLVDSFVWANTPDPQCAGTIEGPGCGTAPPA